MLIKRCGMFLGINQLVCLAAIIAAGYIILYIRRKADGTKSLYKIVLLLLGMAITVAAAIGNNNLVIIGLPIDSLAILILIILVFELSIRLNPNNIIPGKRNIKLFASMLLANSIILGLVSIFLLKASPGEATIFAIMMTSVEYFIVEDIREEGDFSNPLITIIIFILIHFFNLKDNVIYNLMNLMQYLFMGLAMGIALSIIIIKCINNRKITWIDEIGMIASVITAYIFSEYLGGSGLIAVMTIGIVFGNSFVKKQSNIQSFSPFVLKTLEILIYVFLGYVVASSTPTLRLMFDSIAGALALYIIYAIIRFVIIYLNNKHYSLKNIILLTFAPKGMVFAIIALALYSYGIISTILLITSFIILLISLALSTIAEHFEKKKIRQLEYIYNVLKNIRFGRKKDLKKNVLPRYKHNCK
jgi:hypothetical protein